MLNDQPSDLHHTNNHHTTESITQKERGTIKGSKIQSSAASPFGSSYQTSSTTSLSLQTLITCWRKGKGRSAHILLISWSPPLSFSSHSKVLLETKKRKPTFASGDNEESQLMLMLMKMMVVTMMWMEMKQVMRQSRKVKVFLSVIFLDSWSPIIFYYYHPCGHDPQPPPPLFVSLSLSLIVFRYALHFYFLTSSSSFFIHLKFTRHQYLQDHHHFYFISFSHVAKTFWFLVVSSLVVWSESAVITHHYTFSSHLSTFCCPVRPLIKYWYSLIQTPSSEDELRFPANHSNINHCNHP